MVCGVLFVLKSSLGRAVALGLARKRFTEAIVRPKLREKKVVSFTKEEQRAIERGVLQSGSPHLLGILLALYTGLRIGELLALTWEDVDLASGTLTVSKSCYDSWKNGTYFKVLGTTKTQSSERVIPLPAEIVLHLKSAFQNTRSRFVVPAKSEYGASIRAYQRTFARLLSRLGIERKGFHALRHTFATRALEVGMDVKTLSEVLGHRNPMITLQRYAHSLIEHKTEMMNKIGRLLG